MILALLIALSPVAAAQWLIAYNSKKRAAPLRPAGWIRRG